MTNKVVIFDEELKEQNNLDTLYSVHLLNIMNMKIITIDEYNLIKDMYNKLSITNFKKLKPIFDNIYKSTYKDKEIFIDLINKICSIFNFSIDDIIEDFISNCKLELTVDQKNTAINLFNFLYNNEKIHLIEGFAGTGKTSLITNLVSYCLNNDLCKSIAFSAPTNKAVNVIKEKFNPLILNLTEFEKKKSIYIDFITIHKLLCYKTDYNINGEMIFKKSKGKTFSIYDIVFIDECSMLEKKIVNDILEECKKNNEIKIILVGDPAQLPPVNEKISEIFKLKRNSLMKQVVRSGKNSIIGVCNNVRKWLFNELPNPNISEYAGNGLYLFKNNYIKKKQKYKRFETYIRKNKWFQSFLNNPDGIILAWTNKKVNLYNKEIRKIKFGKNLQKFEIGDKLILGDFYLANCLDKKEQIPFYTSEQVQILNINKKIIEFDEMVIDFPKRVNNIISPINNMINEINKNTGRKYLVYILTIEKNNIKYTINVLTDSGNEKNNLDKEYASEKINDIINYYNNFHKNKINIVEKIIIRNLWKSFNKTFVEPFAKVNYGFSTTVHKSQASSYNNVYVDIDDILNNSNTKEGIRCIYTAKTRAINNLYLLI